MKENTQLLNIIKMKIPWYVLMALLPATAILFLLLGFLGRFFWFFDLFSNFRFQYAIVALIGAVTLSFKKKHRKFAIFAYIATITLFITIFPIYIPPSAKVANTNPVNLRVMQINVFTANGEYKKVEDAILANNPDIILLDEVNEKWLNNISAIRKKYPYSLEESREDNFGIAMFAKIKPDFCEVRISKSAHVPYIYASFILDKSSNKSLAFYGIHPLPPIGKNYFNMRNSQLAEVADEIKKDSCINKILLGDLNITPWSYFFGKLENESGLRNSQLGFGIQPSWPNKLPFLRIPIDHCLVSPTIKVFNRQIADNIGSDHFPLILDLEI